jgi:hypothetical protein
MTDERTEAEKVLHDLGLEAVQQYRAPNVVQALQAVMQDLPAIPKGDRAADASGGYSYRGIEAMTTVIQPLLAKHGVIIVPKAQVLQIVPSPAMKEGWQDTYLDVEWKIYGPNGSEISARTQGVGRDKSDKGANKAQTQAFKYLLLDLFCISDSKDDPDGADYEEHVETAVAVIDKREQDDLMRRIGTFSAEHQAELVDWFRDHDCPAIKRLPVTRLDDVEAIVSHYEHLEAVQEAEKEAPSE